MRLRFSAFMDLPSLLDSGYHRGTVGKRLEFERDELQRDTSISRTSSGLAIAESPAAQLNVEAVLALVDRIVANGYLKVREKRLLSQDIAASGNRD